MYMLIHIINTYSMAEVLAVIAQVTWQKLHKAQMSAIWSRAVKLIHMLNCSGSRQDFSATQYISNSLLNVAAFVSVKYRWSLFRYYN